MMKFSVEISLDNLRKIEIRNLEFENGKINFVFGESGVGKTLISQALLGLLDEKQFKIKINDETYSQYLSALGVSEMIKRSFYVFQEPSAHLSPVMKISEQLNEGKIKEPQEKELITKNIFPSLNTKKINELFNVYPTPYRPSGGEKQRVLNLMAFFAMDKLSFSTAWNSLFVFDEPTGHLDVSLRDVLLAELIRIFVKDKPTVVFITHDYSIVSFISEKFPDLKDFFNYSEIYTDGGKLAQRKFLQDEYLKWISSVEPLITKPRKTVLKIKKRIEVYDRTLAFFNENGTETDAVLREGEIIYVKAPSGTGKTTLAKILLGLENANFEAEIDGIKLNGKTPRSVYKKSIYGKRLAIAFQHADEALNQNATVREIFDALENIDSESLRKSFEFLFGEPLENFLEKKIKNLSGGQKQKINVLRALSATAKVTILDEPLNGMDLESVKRTILLLQNHVEKGNAVILISHNEDVFDKIIQKKIYLKEI